MTKRMRRSLGGLCIAALAGLIAFMANGSDGPAANGILSLALLVLVVAGIASLVALAWELLR